MPVFSRQAGRRAARIVHVRAIVRRRFAKSRKKWIFGVAGGLAEYFGVSPMLVRAAFVVGTAFSTIGAVAYLILALLMPNPPPEGE